ncbi:Fusion of ER-derived COPII transport vesicles with the Golgi involved protein [Komagataella phaffii CBS 7435]|uniref:Protein YIF1 n=2 Tax=Komagataella phaffii TaxID=460519 RepID=C4QV65_KOMPG|nr:Integral membrane protein [Komagataella phaffii GS115]AOA61735.1 GQ67_02334T0 [Komagataella phaffii]CAH2445790.1 Fusion of ER-derived COPII transport vesicles with the Golgi involved protein [Komagataella phaffii CBS 7435]AOA65482.1 GQ68_02913T0 [Komagataella phaffii GS115]CAY67138.1 Integral membrane protein [Komagataella phaffii GS115]CCA36246.1 Fusion of ER-derived COPII transport vesicles with the Golgi involved protein [Komagataella phaffii CBS 7435]
MYNAFDSSRGNQGKQANGNPYGQYGYNQPSVPQPVGQNYASHQPSVSQQQYQNEPFSQQTYPPQQPQQHQQQQHQLPQTAPQGGAQQQPFQNFFQDPSSAMGLQFSQTALNASQQYMQQNFNSIMHTQDIKYYFQVSNSYVVRKLGLILFPYRTKTWTRIYHNATPVGGPGSTGQEIYAPATEDINAPDLYIPLMSFLSYILVWSVFAGIHGDFHPELLGYAASKTLALQLLDLVLLKFCIYILSVDAKLWDLVAYSGYKFVAVLVILLIKNIFALQSRAANYSVYFVFAFSLGFFLMRSLRYVVLSTGIRAQQVNISQTKYRTNFLFVYSFVFQGLLVFFMT